MSDAEHACVIPMDPDDVLRTISNSRCHQVILSLAQSESALTASEFAVEIAAIENFVDPSEVTSKQRTRVYVLPIQSHLEALDRAGVVEYNEQGKRVSPTDAMEPVAGYVRRITMACYRPDAERGDGS